MGFAYQDIFDHIKNIDELLNMAIKLSIPFQILQKDEKNPNLLKPIPLEDGVIPINEIYKFDELYNRVFEKDFNILLNSYFNGSISNPGYDARIIQKEYLKISDKFNVKANGRYVTSQILAYTFSDWNLSDEFRKEYFKLIKCFERIYNRILQDKALIGDFVFNVHNDGSSLERVVELYSYFISRFEMIQTYSTQGHDKDELSKIYNECVGHLRPLIVDVDGKSLLLKAQTEIKKAIVENKTGQLAIYNKIYHTSLLTLYNNIQRLQKTFTRTSTPLPFNYIMDYLQFNGDIKYELLTQLMEFCKLHLDEMPNNQNKSIQSVNSTKTQMMPIQDKLFGNYLNHLNQQRSTIPNICDVIEKVIEEYHTCCLIHASNLDEYSFILNNSENDSIHSHLVNHLIKISRERSELLNVYSTIQESQKESFLIEMILLYRYGLLQSKFDRTLKNVDYIELSKKLKLDYDFWIDQYRQTKEHNQLSSILDDIQFAKILDQNERFVESHTSQNFKDWKIDLDNGVFSIEYLSPKGMDLEERYILCKECFITEFLDNRKQDFDEETCLLYYTSKYSKAVSIEAIEYFTFLKRKLDLLQRSNHIKTLEVNPEDIENFSKLLNISPTVQEWQEYMKNHSEIEVKRKICELLHDSVQIDWGGELNDHFTTSTSINGKRISAAFLLKGPSGGSKFRAMIPKHLGKNGDQINRLVKTSAELVIIQHCHDIGETVREQLQAFASAPQNLKKYCFIDGKDTYRILKAYGKL